MTNNVESPDPAAVFGAALSLWQTCQKPAEDPALNLSECYGGMDGFMREVMRIATCFETWACAHIDFHQLDGVWPYLLQDKFGAACLEVILPSALAEFDESDCLRVALHLRLPVKLDDGLPVPISIVASNPIQGSGFRHFSIQTVRASAEDNDIVRFTANDDPFDAEWSAPYFALYGVGADGLLEHIADRNSYAEAMSLAKKLAPGIEFPPAPTFSIAH